MDNHSAEPVVDVQPSDFNDNLEDDKEEEEVNGASRQSSVDVKIGSQWHSLSRHNSWQSSGPETPSDSSPDSCPVIPGEDDEELTTPEINSSSQASESIGDFSPEEASENSNGNMASGSEGHGSVQQQPGTGVQQQGNRLDPAASYPSLSLPVNSSTASCPPSPAVPMSPAGIPAPAAATPTLLSSSASPVTSSATPTATWSGGSHGSNSSGGDDLQPPQLRMPGTPPSPFTRRSSSPDISSSPRRTSPSPCPPADLTSSSSSPAVYSSVQVTSPKCSTSRETSIEKDKSSISDGSILADQTSVEGGETSGGSGSARSLELHALRSNESINGHKTAGHQRSGGRKKSAWYQMLNPTYRSRCEDFKRIFKDLPSDERLIVDYSCALQRDILLQGRIYVTQNYLCFYANIFRWETLVQLRWKDVAAVTKEKTALVIPNAIQINTDSDKHFFCSFGARDKTYVVLFRTWQQALLDQPLGNQELWKFVHSVYGEELGFSSNDEVDEVPAIGIGTPSSDHQNPGHPHIPSSPSPSLHSAQTSNDDNDSVQQLKLNRVHLHEQSNHTVNDWRPVESALTINNNNGGSDDVGGIEDGGGGEPIGSLYAVNNTDTRSGVVKEMTDLNNLPTDMSDTTDSEDERALGIGDETVQCPVTHEGREVLNLVLPISVDELFTLLFANSSFYMDFLQTIRKGYDLVMSPWQESESSSEKVRQVAYTFPLQNNLGVKSTRTSESQTILDVSRVGDLYAVHSEVTNGGIPYADTFYVSIHYCVLRCGHRQSRLVVNAQIKYRKSVWGIVKTFIEKNSWSGLEDHFNQLKRALQASHTRYAEERNERRAELPAQLPASAAGIPSLKSRHHRPQRRRRVKDDNGTEMRRIGSHRVPVSLSESQVVIRTTNSIPSAGVGAQMTDRSSSSTTWSSSSKRVLKIVLVALLGLVLINGFLFSRLVALEQLAEQLSQSGSCPSASAPNLADLKILAMKPQTPEQWTALLHEQEAAHRTSESRWRSTLSTVNSFLKQMQDSLMNLERDMKPDPDLIRDILDHAHQQPAAKEATPSVNSRPPEQPQSSGLLSDLPSDHSSDHSEANR